MMLILFCVYARRIQQMLFHIQKRRESIVSWFILEWAFGDASVLMDDGQISRLLLFHCITT